MGKIHEKQMSRIKLIPTYTWHEGLIPIICFRSPLYVWFEFLFSVSSKTEWFTVPKYQSIYARHWNSQCSQWGIYILSVVPGNSCRDDLRGYQSQLLTSGTGYCHCSRPGRMDDILAAIPHSYLNWKSLLTFFQLNDFGGMLSQPECHSVTSVR